MQVYTFFNHPLIRNHFYVWLLLTKKNRANIVCEASAADNAQRRNASQASLTFPMRIYTCILFKLQIYNTRNKKNVKNKNSNILFSKRMVLFCFEYYINMSCDYYAQEIISSHKVMEMNFFGALLLTMRQQNFSSLLKIRIYICSIFLFYFTSSRKWSRKKKKTYSSHTASSNLSKLKCAIMPQTCWSNLASIKCV